MRGFARARSRPRRRPGWDRAALFAAGLATGFAALVHLHEPAQRLASAHMLQHVLIGDLAPLLVLLALRGPLFHAVLPRTFRRALARRPLRTLLRPGPSFLAWVALLWVWHIPVVYDAALRSEPLHALEHVSFALGGLLLWNLLLDPAGRRQPALWTSLAYALAAMVAAQLLVMTLVVSYRPLYAYGDAGDQSLAGLVMALEQFATLGAFALVRLRAHFRLPLAPSGARHPLGT